MLNCRDGLIYKVSMDSYVSHDGFRLVNNVLKEEYDDMKEKFKQIVENYLIYRTLRFL